MKSLRLALIGSGNITRTIHVPKLATLPQIKLRACMDIVEDRARERAEQGGADYHTTDLQRVLNDPDVDAVMVCTLADMHVPLCIAAARAGKPILSEKPMGETVAQCRELMHVLRETGTPYMVGYCYRFNRMVEHVHPAVTPDFSLAHVLSPDDVPTYQGFINNLCHAFDLLVYFHRSEPVEVLAQGNKPWPCPLRDTTGRLAINIHFANGSLAVIVAGQNAGSTHLGKWYYKFCTPEGATAEVINYRAATIRPGEANDLADEDAYHTGHAKQLELFADAVVNHKPMPVTAEDGLRVNVMMDAVKRSYESGHSISMDSIGNE